MEKLLAQARVYYIFAYGRDSTTYEDKKWILGRVYFTAQRIILRFRDRSWQIAYGDIAEIEEKDKYSRISPPMGWSRGSILEVRHYEDSSKRHILITLLSADFDTVTKMKAIISRLAFGERRNIGEMHRKLLLMISLGIRNVAIMSYILGISREEYTALLNDLRLNGLVKENMELTPEGRKLVDGIRKSF